VNSIVLESEKLERHRTLNWFGKIACRLMPLPPVSILFEQYSRERRMRVMRLFAESTFDVDNALKTWLEKAGPNKTRKARPD
jgi:hypothetical protein